MAFAPDVAPFRRRLLPLLSLFLFLASAALSFALDPASLKPTGYVNDFAGVLDESGKAALERYCADVERATGAQMAVVTVNSLEGEPIEDFANTLYRAWGIGKKGSDEGVLLLLAIRDRKSRVEVGYGLEPVLPDGFVGSVLREMRPSLRENNFAGALQAGASEIGQRIAESKGVEVQRTVPRRSAPPRSEGEGSGFPAGAVILGLIVLFLLISRGGGGGGFLTGMLLGHLLGGGRRGGGGFGGGGGWGGGGFGGGSGGWGGFGGGDSGGGGASGSW